MSDHKYIYQDKDVDDSKPALIAITGKADPEMARMVMSQSPGGNDGRSEWLWVRLGNGDLLLACYPQGETYEMTEGDINRP